MLEPAIHFLFQVVHKLVRLFRRILFEVSQELSCQFRVLSQEFIQVLHLFLAHDALFLDVVLHVERLIHDLFQYFLLITHSVLLFLNEPHLNALNLRPYRV